MNIQQIILGSRPKGIPVASDFKTEQIELPELQEGEVLLKTLYLSVDSYMKGRLSDKKAYLFPFEVGQPVTGGGIAQVENSKSNLLQAGEWVYGHLPWADHCIIPADKLRKIKNTSIPPSYYLGIWGIPGLTAYLGLMEICKPEPNDTIYISDAASAAGILAGQIAKNLGCYVVGGVDSDEEGSKIKQQFEYDDVVNYKTAENLENAIRKACPKGVDCFFDNLGGNITNAVLNNVNFHARIALVGEVTLYKDDSILNGWSMLPQLITKSVLIKGYFVSTYEHLFPEALIQLDYWLEEGKLKYTEMITNGFEQLLKAFIGLYIGTNNGEMIVKI